MEDAEKAKLREDALAEHEKALEAYTKALGRICKLWPNSKSRVHLRAVWGTLTSGNRWNEQQWHSIAAI
ncbi:hypothetical protein H6F89_30230 [Cyanobacteria bacterium FACHB-63]|nr:hypothetical protein [Cyanobacteria bacterium FACHB-63]